MADNLEYISVILPLKLDWEPYYSLPEGVDAAVGDRVRVLFAGRLYLGVVSAVGVKPSPQAIPGIRPVREIPEGKCRIEPTEIAFWRQLADYYMCSIGEVFKAAYTKDKDKEVKATRAEETLCPPTVSVKLEETDTSLFDRLVSEVSESGKVFLNTENRGLLLEALCQKRQDSNILWLVPEKKFEKAMLERLKETIGDRLVVWDSALTPAGKRRAVQRVRSGKPYLVFGTRSALFLPHRNLGLVIIQDEHESSYKQVSPAPRYNGRDAAVMLASIFGAACVLTSPTPSLETIYNCMTGKYCVLGDRRRKSPEYLVVDINAEQRKKGMVGEISRKLIEAASLPFAVYKPRRAAFPEIEDLEGQLTEVFGRKVFLTDDLVEKALPDDIRVLAFFGADAMLGRQDFRADERVFQVISSAVDSAPPTLEKVVIQTREAGHSVFSAVAEGDTGPLLEERRKFSLPPFTRIMDVVVSDSLPEREKNACTRIFGLISSIAPSVLGKGVIRVTLPRDRSLSSVKSGIKFAISEFEKAEKYYGHTYFDVDPVI